MCSGKNYYLCEGDIIFMTVCLFVCPCVCSPACLLVRRSMQILLARTSLNQKMAFGSSYMSLMFESDLDHRLDKKVFSFTYHHYCLGAGIPSLVFHNGHISVQHISKLAIFIKALGIT